MTSEQESEMPHRLELAAISTRLHIQSALGEVDKEALRDDMETQFGTRDLSEANRRFSMLNQWLGENNE